MPLRPLPPRAPLGVARGAVVVCIPVFGAPDEFAQCLRSVLAHTDPGVPVLVADDASPGDEPARLLAEVEAAGALGDRDVVLARQPANAGFVANVNDAFAAADPADVVVVNSDVVVAEGWLEGLRDAAASGDDVATASTLTNSGSILSVPHRNRPVPRLPQDRGLPELAAAVRTASLRLRPRIPTAIGHCFLVRRAALDLVGPFDLAFSPGYGEEVDFSQRCLAAGLSHVVADEVLVLHHGSASFGAARPGQQEHEELVARRHPAYHPWVRQVEADETSPLAHALSTARRAMLGLSVTIDARSLGPVVTGTQIHTLELIRALARTGRVRLRVVLPEDAGPYVGAALGPLEGVQAVAAHEAAALPRTDVAHRPHQVGDEDDLLFLAALGERLVVTHQDLIAFRNPSYFADFAAFERHRALTRAALGSVDRVVFFSRHAAEDALAEDLVEPQRAGVVYLGTEAGPSRPAPPERPPAAPDGAFDVPFLLYLGTDFRHKNRVFALRLLEALHREQGWAGRLVLAGPHASSGTSAGDEAAWLARHPELEPWVVELPAVDDAAKAWLLARTRAVVYPTVHEGFGLVPFEAAAAGAPCCFAPVTSLAEVLPADAAALVPWDPSASAAAVRPLLADGPERERHVALVRDAAARFTWRDTAEGLLETYAEVVEQPPRAVRAMTASAERRASELHAALRKELDVLESIGDDGLRLVAGDPLLPADVQRALLAVSARPRLRGPVFAALRRAYGAGHGLRRGGRDGD